MKPKSKKTILSSENLEKELEELKAIEKKLKREIELKDKELKDFKIKRDKDIKELEAELDSLNSSIEKTKAELDECKNAQKNSTKESNKEIALDELDIKDGISKSGDDEELYISMLDDFVDSYAESSKEFTKFCENKEFAKAKELAQEIKDFSLHIGANNLYSSVASIEEEFEKNDKNNWQKYLEIYTKDLTKLLDNIKSYKESIYK